MKIFLLFYMCHFAMGLTHCYKTTVFYIYYYHDVWNEKARMVWLPDGEEISKISLFILTECTNVTDGHRMTA